MPPSDQWKSRLFEAINELRQAISDQNTDIEVLKIKVNILMKIVGAVGTLLLVGIGGIAINAIFGGG